MELARWGLFASTTLMLVTMTAGWEARISEASFANDVSLSTELSA